MKPLHVPQHKQPSKPQTLEEALEADRVKAKRFAEMMEYEAAKKKYQENENKS